MKTPTVLTRMCAAVLAIGMYGLFPATAAADPDPVYPYNMMGPGTMGGYGMGPGMMGGGMMNPGMMNPGMMGGGMGMMGGGVMAYGSLNLSKEQRSKINQISDDTRKKHWELMGKTQDLSSTLRNLYDADKPDAAEIGKTYQKIFDLKRQMIESSVDAHNKMDAVLTKEQREQLRKSWPRGHMMWP